MVKLPGFPQFLFDLLFWTFVSPRRLVGHFSIQKRMQLSHLDILEIFALLLFIGCPSSRSDWYSNALALSQLLYHEANSFPGQLGAQVTHSQHPIPQAKPHRLLNQDHETHTPLCNCPFPLLPIMFSDFDLFSPFYSPSIFDII